MQSQPSLYWIYNSTRNRKMDYQISAQVTNVIITDEENFVSISYDSQPFNIDHEGDYEILSGTTDPGLERFESVTISTACVISNY
jgi:hypothetical protein